MSSASELKITSWNCGGFSSRFRKEDFSVLKELSSDIYCIQETKLTHCEGDCGAGGELYRNQTTGDERKEYCECVLECEDFSSHFNYSAISDTRNSTRAQKYGYGLAILWKKDLKDFTCEKMLNSAKITYNAIEAEYEFNSVRVSRGDLQILVINLYIHHNSSAGDKKEIVLDLISRCCLGWDNLVICGDFNLTPEKEKETEPRVFKAFRDELYSRGLNVVDVDMLPPDTITVTSDARLGNGSSSASSSASSSSGSWPDHFITSLFITENCDEPHVAAQKPHNPLAHHPLTLTFNPTLNSAKVFWTSMPYVWNYALHELLLETEPQPNIGNLLSNQIFPETTLYKFTPGQVNHKATKSEYSRTYFGKHFDFSCPPAKCLMKMKVVPKEDRLILELQFDKISSLSDLFQISCRFKIQGKFNKSFGGPAKDLQNEASSFEIPLSHFLNNSKTDFFTTNKQVEVILEITAKYRPKVEPYWEIERNLRIFPPLIDARIRSKSNSGVVVQFPRAVLDRRVKSVTSGTKIELSELTVPIDDTKTLAAFVYYLENGKISTALDHSALCQLAKTAAEWRLDELKKFSLRHLTLTSTDATVCESIAVAKTLEAEQECLDIMYNYVIRRFSSLRLEARKN